MTKPTREEVERWLSVAQSGLIGREYRDVFLKLPDILRGYLAQWEELDTKDENLSDYKEMLDTVLDKADKLEAENQALKASMEAEYIERQAKHIQELVKENEALKEALEGLDSLERYTHLYKDQQP